MAKMLQKSFLKQGFNLHSSHLQRKLKYNSLLSWTNMMMRRRRN